MKIVFLTRRAWPSVGGVEKHILEISKILVKKGHSVTILCEKELGQKKEELAGGIKYIRFTYPHIKYLGLITIWYRLHNLRKIFHSADIIHIHDVFIWGIFIRIFAPRKKVYTTFHGGQDVWPIPLTHKVMVKIAQRFSYGTIAVGDFIGKYFGISPNYITYGGVEKSPNIQKSKISNSFVWLGRLDKKTDLTNFLKYLRAKRVKPEVVYIGDGELRSECEKYGNVTGFVSDTKKYLMTSEYIVPVGYLSYLEAKSAGSKIMTFPESPIKKDYWAGIMKLKSLPTWDEVVNVYMKLWNK